MHALWGAAGAAAMLALSQIARGAERVRVRGWGPPKEAACAAPQQRRPLHLVDFFVSLEVVVKEAKELLSLTVELQSCCGCGAEGA